MENEILPDDIWGTRGEKTYTMLCIEEFMELQRKLEVIKYHFKNHECMYRFDFNLLMDEVSSQFIEEGEEE